jgi:ElaB/YqjD/DUF883 family membrane-anchored ribosome-binding protein
MTTPIAHQRTGWLHLVIGGVVGLVLGMVVSVTTDVPFAPEVGTAIGLLAGWLLHQSGR